MLGFFRLLLIFLSFCLGLAVAGAYGAGITLSVAALDNPLAEVYTEAPVAIESVTSQESYAPSPRAPVVTIHRNTVPLSRTPQEKARAVEQLNLRRAASFLQKGKEKFQAKDYSGAIQDFDSALIWNSQLTDAWFHRGTAHVAVGDMSRADRDFSQVIRMSPKNWSAWYNRGCVRLARGKYEEAIKDFNHDIKARPQHAEAYCNRGNSYLKIGLRDMAVRDYLQAVQLRPNDYAYPYNNIGVVFLESALKETSAQRERDLAEAAQWFHKAAKILPQWSAPWKNRAIALGQLRQYAAAIEIADHVVALTSGEADSYYQRALLRFDAGDAKGALADLDLAISLAPAVPDYFSRRAAIASEQRDYEQAAADMEQYLRHRPYDADARLEYRHLVNKRDSARSASLDGTRRSQAAE